MKKNCRNTKCCQFFDQIDLFGIQPSLRIDNKPKFTSIIGITFTIVIMCLMIGFLISDLIDMFSKTQPSVYISEEQIFETPAFPLLNENFTIALSTTDINNNHIEDQDKYYKVQINGCSRYRITNEDQTIKIVQNCTELPVETCTLDHFNTPVQKEYFSRIKLGSMKCINRDALQNNPPVLQGQFSAYQAQYLLIYVKVCQNTTDSQNCASTEEIQDKLSAVHYIIYSTEYLLKQTNSGDPYEQIIVAYYSTFSNTTSKRILQYYQIIETTTDSGLVTEETTVQTAIRQNGYDELTDIYNEKYLIEHYVVLDYKQTNYYRSYIKLQTILGKIGGIWQLLLIAITILFKPIFMGLMNISIANHIFRFDNQDKTIEDNTEGITIKSPNTSPKNQFNFKKKNTKLTTNLCDSIRIAIGLDRKNYKLYQKAKNEINNSIDLLTIIQKLKEIDILKTILLTEEELQLFNLIPKPKLSFLCKDNGILLNQLTRHSFQKSQQTIQGNQSSSIQINNKKSYQREQYINAILHSREQQNNNYNSLLGTKLLKFFNTTVMIPDIKQSQQQQQQQYSISQNLDEMNEPAIQIPKLMNK